MTDNPYERMAAHPFKWFAERLLIMSMCGLAAAAGIVFGAWTALQHCGVSP